MTLWHDTQNHFLDGPCCLTNYFTCIIVHGHTDGHGRYVCVCVCVCRGCVDTYKYGRRRCIILRVLVYSTSSSDPYIQTGGEGEGTDLIPGYLVLDDCGPERTRVKENQTLTRSSSGNTWTCAFKSRSGPVHAHTWRLAPPV